MGDREALLLEEGREAPLDAADLVDPDEDKIGPQRVQTQVMLAFCYGASLVECRIVGANQFRR